MSGPNDSRPHRDLGTFDIQERIRRLEGWIRKDQREYDRLRRMGATEDAENKWLTIKMHEREIAAFHEELRIREKEKELAREKRGGRGGQASNLVTVACSCQRPRHFKLPGKVYEIGPIICGNCNQPFKLT
jgi:hypothetical protein